jgi:carbonic anhydrase/acetyltransferase-like protein (isoleucine patch superfamily)
MRDEWPLELGDNVTIGHGVILHGCKIESRVLVGMGCTIMNGARIGTGSIIAAGTLIPEGAVVPPGSLFMGHPGKLRRELAAADQASVDMYAQRYVEYKETYRAEVGK